MTQMPGARERLEKDYHLWVLRLSLDNFQVLFDVSSSGNQLALLTASAEEMGIPCHSDFPEEGDHGLEADLFRLPLHIASSLKTLLCDPNNRAPSLWIRLSKPVGLLTAVPWECLLQPLLDIPILRLPYHVIRPREPREKIDTVICFSSPATEPAMEISLVDQFSNLIPSALARQTHFHIFADHAIYNYLVALQQKYQGQYKITVYPPPSHKLKGNPWFSWISDCLRPHSADVVHLLCHSYRIREQGYLVLAKSPGGSHSEILVCAEEVVEFLNCIGAWSLALTAPPTIYSTAAMLMLLDSVAQLRPGPVLLHDMKISDNGSALQAAYRFLYQNGQAPPMSSAISLNCHPSRQGGFSTDEQSNALLDQYTLAGKLGKLFAESNQPVWLASAQRVLEASAGQVAAEVEADPNSGRARARKLVVDALAESAHTVDDEQGPMAAGGV